MKTSKKIIFAFLCLLVMGNVSLWAEEFDPTKNIALNKPTEASSENGTSIAANAVNEIANDRWESIHKNDDEWWYVDLGDVYNLNYIEIRWEGAYAKSFELLATKEMQDSDQENAEWEVIYSVTDEGLTGLPKYVQYNVNGKVGRYIKFQGVERALDAYGYSFYDFRVYANGLYVDADDRVLEKVVVAPNPIEVYEGEEIQFFVSALCNYGGAFDDVTYSFNVDNGQGIEIIEGDVNYYVKGLVEGEFEFTVTGKDNNEGHEVQSDPVTVVVSQAKRLETLSITFPSIYEETEVFAVVGRDINLNLVRKDQYGQDFAAEIEWIITPEENGYIDGNRFIPAKKGETTIKAQSGSLYSELEITIISTGENVALNKTATSSSDDIPGGTNANLALSDNNEPWVHPHPAEENDQFRDYDAWIIVDLGEVYEELNLIEILWEGACAADYEITYSEDGENYELLGKREGPQGVNGKVHQYGSIDGISARYLQVYSTKAATQYGVKIIAIRAFADKPLEPLEIVERIGNHIVLKGDWSREEFEEIDEEGITSYDMSEVVGLIIKPVTKNPNCLIFVEANATIAGSDNVVAGQVAGRIVLQDEYAYDNSKIEFHTTVGVRYTRDFTGMNGWASLYLPFPIEDLQGLKVESFTSYNEGEASIHFTEVNTIAANTPYIIQVDQYTGKVTFALEDRTVVIPLSSNTNHTERGDFTFKGTFETIPGEGTLMLRNNGSEFVVGGAGSDIPAFRAYIEANNGSTSVKSLSVVHDGEGTTNVGDVVTQDDLRVIGGNGSMEIISASSQTVYVYSVNGQLIGKVKLDAGYNKVNGLAQGVYVVNNQKVIIK